MRSERGHDDVASRSQSFEQTRQIGVLIGFPGEEVKHGTVVPEVDLLRQMQITRIRDKPIHLAGPGTQACPGCIQGGVGDINHGQFLEATFEELVDKSGRTAPDVNNLII